MAHPAGGMGQHLATLTDKQITLEPDGTFRVTIDSKPINGRSNHLPVASGRLLLAARDSRSDWAQEATTLSLRLVEGNGITPAPSQAALIDRIVKAAPAFVDYWRRFKDGFRSEEHTSELQSLMRISYAVFCLKKTKKKQYTTSKQTNHENN